MPVTIKPAPHKAETAYFGEKSPAKVALDVFGVALRVRQRRHALACSTPLGTKSFRGTAVRNPSYGPQTIVIRPEDVWFAIISQFSYYVNANAEVLREMFVAHKGKKQLVVNMGGHDRYNVDYGDFAREMASLIEENVVDADLKTWVVPDFSTTTESDRVVASILLMGVTQKYFTYTCSLLCGLPSVTLLGEKADWENIYARLGKLEMYGEGPKTFCRLLLPVIAHFIKSFEEPESKDTIKFWQQIAHRQSGGSGPSYYTGWITAFCLWDVEGRNLDKRDRWDKTLNLDGVNYPIIKCQDVPEGYTTVPVKITECREKTDSIMVAGSIGIRYSYTGSEPRGKDSDMNTISPETGWGIFEAKNQEKLG